MTNIASSKRLGLLLLIASSLLSLIQGAGVRGMGHVNDIDQYGNDNDDYEQYKKTTASGDDDFLLALNDESATDNEGLSDFLTLATDDDQKMLDSSRTGYVHIQGYGDVPFTFGEWAGTRGKSLRLEGFQLSDDWFEYYGHLQSIGDTPWVSGGSYVGTKGESRRMEGFAIRLKGKYADQYSVYYQGHLQGIGDTKVFKDGEFCGTRGQSRRLEGIKIWVKALPKPYSKFSLHTATALHETGGNFEFLLAPNLDVYAIKKTQTGSGRTEVHVLSKASGYKRFSLHRATALHETGGNFEFLLAPNLDLYAIKKSQTGSGSTEVHVLSKASGYRQFSLHTGTALHESGGNFEFLLAPNLDLYAIKKSQTGSKTTEVHVLSKASGYKKFSLHTGTALHETGGNFEFLLAPNLDVYAIKKNQTGSGSTEVHVLSRASGYKKFGLHTGTALHESGGNFEFLLAPSLDVYAIKEDQTGSKTTEVHVLSKASS